MIITFNASKCAYYDTHTCPEYDDAVFKTISFRVSEFVELKLYPTNVMFYLWLMLVPLFAIVLRSNEFCRYYVLGKIAVVYVAVTMLLSC